MSVVESKYVDRGDCVIAGSPLIELADQGTN